MTVVVPTSAVTASPPHVETYGYAEVDRDAEATFYTPDGAALASPGIPGDALPEHPRGGGCSQGGAGLRAEAGPDRRRRSGRPLDRRGQLMRRGNWPSTTRLSAGSCDETWRRRCWRTCAPVCPGGLWDAVSFYRLAVDETRFGGVLHFERPRSGAAGGHRREGNRRDLTADQSAGKAGPDRLLSPCRLGSEGGDTLLGGGMGGEEGCETAAASGEGVDDRERGAGRVHVHRDAAGA